ncbi:hypothetical protein F4009_18830 [Candidatus Poribacteria bacterium]|nr:hypothetical protein [Candidatus Poribacteria bacterium]MYH80588.1 hypothetical protein [Candidatus Poribacteria bacterium]MYK96024.1 hypothetical protein [Candidatus Poribacteria bacterium]
MQTNIFTLPVSLEQVAALIKRMHPEDRQQLLAMVPELAIDAVKQKKLIDEANQTVEQLKEDLLAELGGEPLSSDEPFLDGFTLGQYLELSETERAKLWDEWSEVALEDIEEVEVHPNALPAR